MSPVSRVAAWARDTAGVVRAVLANPPLRNVLIAYLVYVSALYGTWTAMLLWAVAALGTSQVGIAVAVQLLPAAAFAAVAATLADRYPRGRVLAVGYGLQALAFGSAGVGMLAGASSVVVLLALAVAAAGTTMPRPTQGALLPQLARSPAELTAANALAGTVEGLGILLGPLLTAGILLVQPEGAALLAWAAALVGVAALVSRLRPAAAVTSADPIEPEAPAPADAQAPTAAPAPAAPWRGPTARIRRGLRTMTASADFAVVVGVLGLRMLVMAMLDIVVVLLALNVLGIGGSGAGALQSFVGLGTLLGGAASVVLVGRRQLAIALAASAVLLGGPLVALGLAKTALIAPVLLAVAGIGTTLVDVTGRTLLQRFADPARLAAVLGSLEAVDLAGCAAGSVIAPILVGVVGIEGTLVISGLLMPAAVAATWLTLRRIDRRATVPVRELALLRANRVFAALPGPQLETVARRMQWLSPRAGAVLIREGDPGDRYYILVEGSLRVTAGGAFLSEWRRPGDGLGEIALVRGIPRTATVTASSPSIVLALGRDDFLSAVTGSEPASAAAEEAIAAVGHSTPEPAS